MNEHHIMDYETISNLFVGVFIGLKSDNEHVFIIHESKNDLLKLIEFFETNIKDKTRHISFNGLEFDSQLTQYILENKKKLLSFTGDVVAKMLYQQSQIVINSERPIYPEYKLSIRCVDVYKMNHFDNKAKHCSLKWAQGAMDWPIVMDMPIKHTDAVHDAKTINDVVFYCKNDVRSTKQVLILSKSLVDIRNMIDKKYHLNCMNYSNSKLGSELLLKLYCDATGKDKWEVRQSRTYRTSILLKDVIFPFIKFKTKTFQDLYDKLYNLEVFELKDSFKEVVNYKGFELTYGLGGVHSSQRGIFKSDNDNIIYDIDVQGFYPNNAVINHMYPAHLGPEFYRVYKEDIVDVRNAEKQKPKDRDIAIIEGFKEAGNSAYGKSNSVYSWVYDPFYTLQTTVNCQLQLTMLLEEIVETLDITLIQTNTDGITILLKRKHEQVFLDICKKWENLTKHTLEYLKYSAMYVFDVNNYLAVKESGGTKCKGRFEWEALAAHKHTHLHKNKSFLVVAKGVYEYFVNNIMPEVYIKTNTNIYDYCGLARANEGWTFIEHKVVNSEYFYNKLQKTLRFYISKKGSKIYKVSCSTKSHIIAGKWMQTPFLNYVKKEWNDYDIDYDFYIKEMYKEINLLVIPETKQLSLF